MAATTPSERTINIVVLEYKATHLLVATSPDLPGLYVAARSEEQIIKEVPDAVRELLEAEGAVVRTVTAKPKGTVPHGFEVREIVASAWTEGLAEVA